VKPTNTFFVISNINSAHSQFTPDQRFVQTLETFYSIRLMAPGSAIIFCDNSTIPLTEHQLAIIRANVDHTVDFKNNLFTEWINSHGRNKGLNEVLVYREMLDSAMAAGLIGGRIFKISGRYRLRDSFDILEYGKPQYVGKYIFTITPWIFNDGVNTWVKNFYNTALWSMCSTLTGDYASRCKEIFECMLTENENIEMSHNKLIPVEKLVIFPKVHGCGLITNGSWTEF